jgi:hypothetical protein
MRRYASSKNAPAWHRGSSHHLDNFTKASYSTVA